MMELLLKIVAGALAAVMCTAVLRRSAPEFAVPMVLACGAWVIYMLAQAVGQTVQMLVRLAGMAKLETHVVEPVIKVVGLSVVTRIGVEVCRSAGEGGVAAFVEIAGTALSLAAAMPLVNGVLELITELLV